MSQKITIELLGSAPNATVLKLPWRHFPGILVQGDSLWTLLQHAEAIRDRVKQSNDDDVRFETAALVERLDDLVTEYEAPLASHGISLPYNKQGK